MSDQSSALKACPFCGGSAEMHADGEQSYWIECANSACGSSTNIRISIMEDVRPMLVEQWNRRSIPTDSLQSGMDARTEQIRRAHASAKPTAVNPAWKNCHHDMAHLIAHIDGLKESRVSRLSEKSKMPMLPQRLIDLIGHYGMARTDGAHQLEIQHRWECLIRGIKDYARDVVNPSSNQ